MHGKHFFDMALNFSEKRQTHRPLARFID